LVVGAGALGACAVTVLARAGVRELTLLDPDRVETANLATQPLYRDADVGRPKAETAAERLADSGCKIAARVERLVESNADALVGSHDFVIDACDHPPTKFLINAAAVRTGTRFCYAGVSRTGGLVLPVEPRRSACLACVFPDIADSLANGEAAGCHETGILGPVAGVVGALQARSALAALGLVAAPFHAGRLALYEMRGRRWSFLDFARDARCRVCSTGEALARERRIEPCHS